MRTVKLEGTDIATSAMGLECATLFHLPDPADRRLLLDAAYDAGVRHFDVAPIYGLGLAEAELASFLGRRRSAVTITTKFGIRPTALGRLAGRAQRPVRAALNRLPSVGQGIREAGGGPGSGPAGRLLYSTGPYTPHSAQMSLERSLHALRTDHVDIFLLHDPLGDLLTSTPALVDYLDSEVDRGRIRNWGASRDTGTPSAPVRAFSRLGQVFQSRDDIFSDLPDHEEMPGKARVTFGTLDRALPVIRAYLERSPDVRNSWSDRLGIDLGNQQSLSDLLIRHAFHRNPSGPILCSSTLSGTVRAAAGQANEKQGDSEAREEALALSDLAALVKFENPRLGPS